MKLFSIPSRIEALIFDVDSTLYTCGAFADEQIRGQIARLAERRGTSYEAMSVLIEEQRERYAAEHGGGKISLGNLFVEFGVSIEESIRWREELIDPRGYLAEDIRLQETLAELGKRFAMGVATNNPEKTARRILAALGVEASFSAVIGLDTCGVSKPHAAPYMRAAERLGADLRVCVSVGDRYDIDIALPLELGMGGILVDGVEDVYALPQTLPQALIGK